MVARDKKLCKAAAQIKNAGLAGIGGGRARGGVRTSANGLFRISIGVVAGRRRADIRTIYLAWKTLRRSRAMGRILDRKFLFARHWKLAALAACLFFVTSNVEAQRAYFGQTTDPTPVDVAIQDKNEILNFRIPKMYLTFSKNWNGGLQEFLVLEVLFPSMAPRSSVANTITIGPDVLVINLEFFYNTGAENSIPKLIRYFVADQWAFVEDITDNKGRRYKYYVNKRDVEKRQDSTLLKEFFVPDEQGIYFECLREAANPHVGCSGVLNYGQNLSLRFQFRRSQFERWPEIRDAAIALLNSLRQQTGSQQ